MMSKNVNPHLVYFIILLNYQTLRYDCIDELVRDGENGQLFSGIDVVFLHIWLVLPFSGVASSSCIILFVSFEKDNLTRLTPL